VFPRRDSVESVDVTFEVKAGGEVIVDPWPFSIPVISGVAYAFESVGYPNTLNPLVVPFNISGNPMD
jgi:hypothetical protein